MARMNGYAQRVVEGGAWIALFINGAIGNERRERTLIRLRNIQRARRTRVGVGDSEDARDDRRIVRWTLSPEPLIEGAAERRQIHFYSILDCLRAVGVDRPLTRPQKTGEQMTRRKRLRPPRLTRDLQTSQQHPAETTGNAAAFDIRDLLRCGGRTTLLDIQRQAHPQIRLG